MFDSNASKYVKPNLLLNVSGPYSTSKLELKSNLSEILPVSCEFICDSTRN